MPRRGYSTVTIPMQVHRRLHETAQKEYRSMSKQIEHMLDTLYPRPTTRGRCKACGYHIADTKGAAAPKFCANCGAAIPQTGGKAP